MVMLIRLTVVNAIDLCWFRWDGIACSIFIINGWEFWETFSGALTLGRFLRWRGNRIGVDVTYQGAKSR